MNDRQSNTDRRALIIAGPNGAGKTTFAREFLPAEGHCPTFINADLIAIERVRRRVAQGGHNIPENDIRRRFDRGLENFRETYRRIVDTWQLYDASQWPPIILDEGTNP